jgi:integrase
MKLKFLGSDIDRHGRRRWFVRAGKRGARRKIRIPGNPGMPGFFQAHETALATLNQPSERKGARIIPNSIRWLAEQYFGSPQFATLSQGTRTQRQQDIESCLREPLTPGSDHFVGDCPVAKFSAKHVQMLRDRKAKSPGAANNRRKVMSAMFAWAIDQDLGLDKNPCRDVKKLDYETEGHKAWTEEDLTRFESHYPIGTKPRLALALLLYTGARRSDAILLGPSNIRDGLVRFVPHKTKRTRKEATPKPWLPELARIVAATRVQGTQTFLVNDYGRPFTPTGFTAWFVKCCGDAGLVDCSPHGLRKLGAMRAAEAGATHFQLMSMYDWSSPAQAQHYVQLAERKRAAATAMAMIAQRAGS